MLLSEDPSWPHYTETVLAFFDEPPLRIDLRRPVTESMRAALVAGGLDGAFAVITAANPRGRLATDEENSWYREELRTALLERHAGLVRATGLSPDGRHREEGFAAPIDRPEAIGLARRFGQSALFWFDGMDFWLVPVLVSAVPARLPLTPPPTETD